MSYNLDRQGLARLAGFILNERHPSSKESAHELLNAQMGAYIQSKQFACEAVDRYFNQGHLLP